MWPLAREKSGTCLQCVWQRSTRSTETLMVFQCDPWILLGGITHHKPTPQKCVIPTADRNRWNWKGKCPVKADYDIWTKRAGNLRKLKEDFIMRHKDRSSCDVELINLGNGFWGHFWPRSTKTRHIFLIGQGYLTLLEVCLCYEMPQNMVCSNIQHTILLYTNP